MGLEDGGSKEVTAADSQKHYKILKADEIRQLQEKDVSDVSNLLSVSRSVACNLLCQNRWSLRSVFNSWMTSSVYDRWFERPLVNLEKQGNFENEICNICYETTRTTLSAGCVHPFCVDCWKTYISISIENGPGCLTLTCPEPGCQFHPGLDMVGLVSSPDDKVKYYRYLYRSYVESSPKRKWCPAPGCDLAIEFDAGEGQGFDISCNCGCRFCWSCVDESHSPLDCETVAKWMEKNSSESENTNWILAYTKPCPKCRRSIEKNHGCNHMTCRPPCGFNFCWLCLGPSSHPGGQCNVYREDSQKLAKEHLERYTHYYERWDTNEKSMKIALGDLSTKQTHSQTMFVVEAWEQIVECRRVLKWSYAYGYYNMSGSARRKLNLFEHLQWEAENALERLHHCAETEMDTYLSADCPCEDFNVFRKKLLVLTSVTKNYFENLVRALENNLSEVEIVDRKYKEEAFITAPIIADEEAYIAEDFYFNFRQ
ncbi:probable E3 ubiquitin-protein ligase ari8 [Phtheirospermum japonicum]|uniref:RBR-type E3 ubiquitin transferase n=1 Tax=Phtheirospermum japonicum TaxID=374723 RepID=A0A830CWP1_9LAMI|nr:probable E3 ubiquitin-protein ligase ari8 [Phtheirospermum japonicum]